MRPEDERDLLTLLKNPALDRLVARLRASYERNGRPAGTQQVATYQESDALADLIGKRVKPGKTIRVEEIDRLLREKTRFRCTLHEALELYDRRPIVTKKEVRAQSEAEWQASRKRCFDLVRDLALPAEAYARVVTWLNGDEKRVRAHVRKWRDDGIRDVRVVAAVFGELPGRGGASVYLSELAARVAGGQHGLNVRIPAGRLLYYALAYTFPETAGRFKRRSALWRTSLLTEAGIARDPISSIVHAYGLDGDTPYLRELRAAGYDRPLSLLTLRDIRRDVRAWRGYAFVFENPIVYAAMIERLRMFDRRYHPTLICTTGVLNLADWELLEALTVNGAHLFYSGDFDKAGLDIAASILTRYEESASPWRLAPDDYLSALQEDRTLAPETLQRLAIHFPELVREMAARGKSGDQEKLIGVLAGDLRRFITEGVAPPRRGDPPGGAVAETAYA